MGKFVITEEEKKRIKDLYNNGLNESFLNKSTIQSATQKLSSCWDSKKYPNLMKITNGSMEVLWGLVLIAFGASMDYFSFGFMVIPASLSISKGGITTYDGVKELYEVNKDKISGELSKFGKCLGLM